MKIISKLLSLLMCLTLLFTVCTPAAQAASISVAAPSKVTVTTTADTVKLSWSKVSKATGYRVYQKVSGKWKAVKTVKSNTHTVKGLTASETYSFAVKSYRKYNGKTYWSSKYTTASAKTKAMGSTPAPKATPSKNSVALKWSKVAGATGYRVYQYKSGSWVKIASIKSNTYTVKSLKVDTTYKFKIKPYAKTSKGTVWGKTSSAVSAKTVDNTKTKFTSSDVSVNDVTLAWSKISGATGYRLYLVENGQLKKLKTTSAVSYKVTGLNSNSTYTFMVRAYKKASGKVTWYTKSDTLTLTTNPAESDLKAYRLENYQKIFENQQLYLRLKTVDADLGQMPMEFARKNGNMVMKTSMDGLTLRMFYVKKTDTMYMYLDEMKMYAIVPEEEMDDFDMSEMVDALAIKNVGDITVTIEKFDGKTVICESFVDTVYGETHKYYFHADVLIGHERISKYGSKETIYIDEVSNSVSDDIFTRPKLYINISGLM